MKEYSYSTKVLILAVTFCVVGFLLGVYLEPHYFSRFGAVVVLLAVTSEYALLKKEFSGLYMALNGLGAAEAGNTGIPDLSPPKVHRVLAYCSHMAVMTGTFIWGFGDLILAK